MKNITIIFVLLLGSLGSCNTLSSVPERVNSLEQKTVISESSYKDIARRKYIKDVDYLFNSDKTYVICYGKKSNLSGGFSFFVYSLNDNMKVFDTSVEVEKVLWKSSYEFEYYRVPGVVRVDDDSSQPIYINLKD